MKVVAALAVLILLLLAPSVVSQVPDDKPIVPGVRIGKWTLEMTIDTLLQMNVRETFCRAYTHQAPPSIQCGVGFQTAVTRFGGTTGPTSVSRQPRGVEMHSRLRTSSSSVAISRRARIRSWDGPPGCRECLWAAHGSDAGGNRRKGVDAAIDLRRNRPRSPHRPK